MKWLLTALIVLFLMVPADFAQTSDPVPIAVVTIYYYEGSFISTVDGDTRFFATEEQVYYKLFERYVLLNDKETLHNYVDFVKNIQDSIAIKKELFSEEKRKF